VGSGFNRDFQQSDDSNFAQRTPVLHILLASQRRPKHGRVYVVVDVLVLVDVDGLYS
jgi:hypothetical protein